MLINRIKYICVLVCAKKFFLNLTYLFYNLNCYLINNLYLILSFNSYFNMLILKLEKNQSTNVIIF